MKYWFFWYELSLSSLLHFILIVKYLLKEEAVGWGIFIKISSIKIVNMVA